MKKIIKISITMIILFLLSGCNEIILRKDLQEKVTFKSQNIVQGKNVIELNSLEYPREYHERLRYVEEFETVAEKLLLEEKNLNLLVSSEMYQTLEGLRNNSFLKDEEIYLKNASDLHETEKNKIDSDVEIIVTDAAGSVQMYLNKQVYFLLKMRGRERVFDGNNLYTELDKERIIEKIREEREELSRILNVLDLNLIIEVDSPYKDSDRELFEEKVPIYLKNPGEEEMDSLKINGVKLEAPVMILQSEDFTGYTVKDNRYLFYHGGETMKGYYKGYDFEVSIIKRSLNSLVEAKQGILLKEIFLRTPRTIEGIEDKNIQPKNKSLNWGTD